MKKSTKILFILFLIFFIASVIMTKFVIKIIQIENGNLLFQFDVYSIIGLSLITISLVLGSVLYFKFLLSLSLDKVLFFTTIPLMIIYGLLLFLLAQIDKFDNEFASYLKSFLNVTDNATYNLILWAVVLSVVFVLLILFNYVLICRPLSKVERIVTKLGEGIVREEKFSLGGGKQFVSIEHALNRINRNYKESDGSFRYELAQQNPKLTKKIFKFFGKSGILQFENGQSVSRRAVVMSVKLKSSGNQNPSSLEENFDLVNSYISFISPIVNKFSGFIERYYGDGIIVVFQKNEDAISCAHLIAKTIAGKNKREKILPNIVYRISITAGELVFGLVGDNQYKTPSIVSGVNENLEKIEYIGDYVSASMLFSREVIDNLPLNYRVNYRYIGSINIDENKKLALYEDLEVYSKDVSNKLLKMRGDFEFGVRSYENKNFYQSDKIFEQIMRVCPNDKTSFLYYNKSKEKLLKENSIVT